MLIRCVNIDSIDPDMHIQQILIFLYYTYNTILCKLQCHYQLKYQQYYYGKIIGDTEKDLYLYWRWIIYTIIYTLAMHLTDWHCVGANINLKQF